MKINFRETGNPSKVLQFVNGLFQLESDKQSSWIWTTNKVSCVLSNVESITIKAFSDIDNIFIFDGKEIKIRSDSLNIIKLLVSGKHQFDFTLDKQYKATNDERVLGIKIIGLIVDNEVVF